MSWRGGSQQWQSTRIQVPSPILKQTAGWIKPTHNLFSRQEGKRPLGQQYLYKELRVNSISGSKTTTTTTTTICWHLNFFPLHSIYSLTRTFKCSAGGSALVIPCLMQTWTQWGRTPALIGGTALEGGGPTKGQSACCYINLEPGPTATLELWYLKSEFIACFTLY